jgi:hypothetical protein
MRSYANSFLRNLPALGWEIRDATGGLAGPAYALLFGLTGSAAVFVGLAAVAAGDRPRVWFLAVAAILFAAALTSTGRRPWSRWLGVAAGLSGSVVWAYLLARLATHDPLSIAIVGLLAIACLRCATVLANAVPSSGPAVRSMDNGWIEELPDDEQERRSAAD